MQMSFENILYKTSIIISSVYALIRMRHWLLGYTYFTQISNMFMVFVVACQLIFILSRKSEPLLLHDLKYLAVLSLFVTFIVFFASTILADHSRIVAAYTKDSYSSFCMHLLTPMLSLLDFYRNDARTAYRRSIIGISLLPFIIYMSLILILGRTGIRWGIDQRMAPYPFLNYGHAAGWFGGPVRIGTTRIPMVGVAYVLMGSVVMIIGISYMQWRLSRRHA